MRTYKFITGLLLLQMSIVLTGCGSRDVDSDFTGGQAQTIANNKEDAKESFGNFSIHCDDRDNCSESSAAILVYNADRTAVSVCTGFLISKNILMTNSHCVEHFKPGVNCSGSLKALFPAGNKEEAYCKRLIKKGNIDKDLDYALIELDRSLERKPLKINTDGLKDGAIYTMDSVHVANSLNARMVRQSRCTAVQNSMAYPNFRESTSAHIILGECHNQNGYSGSAIVNSDGEVVAINSNILELDDIKLRFNPKVKYLDNNPQTTYVKGENLHCVLAPGVNSEISDVCKAELPLSKRKSTGNTGLAREYAKEQRVLEKNRAYSNLHFTTRFEYSEVTEDKIMTLVPTCIKDPSIWEAEYKNILTILGLKKRNRDRLDVPVFEVKTGFNKYYQMDYEINVIDELEAKYKYPIRVKDLTDDKNTVKFRMKVKTLRARAQLLNLIFPLFWFFPLEEDTKEGWITVFEKDIPMCSGKVKNEETI